MEGEIEDQVSQLRALQVDVQRLNEEANGLKQQYAELTDRRATPSPHTLGPQAAAAHLPLALSTGRPPGSSR